MIQDSRPDPFQKRVEIPAWTRRGEPGIIPRDVLRVPNAALRFRPPPDLLAQSGAAPGGGNRSKSGAGEATRQPSTPDRRTVWVLREEKPVPVRIRTGISDGSFTEVVEGEIKAGDVVITDAIGGSSSGMAAGLRRGL